MSPLGKRWEHLYASIPEAYRDQLHEFASEMTRLVKQLRAENEALAASKAELQSHVERSGSIVRLDVGGKKFATSRANIERLEGSYLASMLSWPPNELGEYFIDVDPTHFGRIMTFVRTDALPMDGLSERDLLELMALVDYLQLPGFAVGNSKLLHWDPKYCSNQLQLSDDGMSVTKKSFSAEFCPVLTVMPLVRFTVHVSSKDTVEIGFTTRELFQNAPRHGAQPGWLLRCGFPRASYLQAFVPQKNVAMRLPLSFKMPVVPSTIAVTCIYDADAHQIRFELNGVLLTETLEIQPSSAALYPVVRLYDPKSVVQLVDIP
ncbi:hypothetical protein ACHHYP_09400 [Achlya hypogyna]|uniref:BTB domain-containing protein n=1 Tax=Achlya hypogyna TaxID=1202772 RepID=A0A1V9YN61_ACHHY|nr:hypothetical protein ACHHYP_09400 [Achlya hypogyna]